MGYAVNLTKSIFPAQSDSELRDMTLGDLLRETAEAFPDKVGLVDVDLSGVVGRSWTYSQMLTDSVSMAHRLAEQFDPGERVTIWSPNSPDWVLMEFACAMAGIVIVTANPSLQTKELRYILEQSNSVALFLVDEYRGNPMKEIAREAIVGLDNLRAVINMDDNKKEVTRNSYNNEKESLPFVDCNDPAMIQYTSGTTGFPKGAVLSHRSLLNNARFYAERLGVNSESVWANIMPMFHTSGCGMVTLGCVQAGCTMLIFRLFDPLAICKIIEQEKVSVILGVPTMLVALLEVLDKETFDVSSVSMFSSGGAMVAPELISEIKEVFDCGFGTLYGQTETSPVVTQHFIDDSFDDIYNTIGQPLPHTEVSIRDVDHNDVVAVGDMGEICVKGYCCMVEYHGNPNATLETVDTDGWLHSGDLGTMDDRGYVRITGRVKDMIIRGGENMFPAEIENSLLEHPSVSEVAVVGIPDDKWGEVIGCFFRSENDEEIPVRLLHDHCRMHLSPQKTPTIWCRVDGFPMTGSRKIQKFAIRDRFLDGEYESLSL